MTLLPLFFPLRTASIMVLPVSFFVCLQLAYKLKAYVNFKLILFPVLGSFIGRTLGIYILMSFPEKILIIILSTLLVVLSFYFAFYNNKVQVVASVKNGVMVGIVSGLFGGMFNIGGPPFVAYYFFSSPNKLE